MEKKIGPLQFGCHDPWIWDDKARSPEVFLCQPRVALFHPSWSNSTAGVRGTRILNNGIHYWELSLSNRVFGTSIMFGVGKSSVKLHNTHFKNLLGEDENSWGLSHKGLIIHGGKKCMFTEPFQENKETVVGVLFNGVMGTLTYYKDGACLGVAFTELDKIKEPLYPIVASTVAKTKISLINTMREFVSLQDTCRDVIAQTLKNPAELDNLCLPINIKSYIRDSMFTVSDSNCISYRRDSFGIKKPFLLR